VGCLSGEAKLCKRALLRNQLMNGGQ
jgi:hypothetical protein